MISSCKNCWRGKRLWALSGSDDARLLQLPTSVSPRTAFGCSCWGVGWLSVSPEAPLL